MTNKELYEIVKSGKQPVVRIKEGFTPEECAFDPGMIGKVVSVKVHEQGTKHEHYEFTINEKDYREVNAPFMKANWYDSSGFPTLTYVQAGHASADGLEDVFVMNTNSEFEIVETEGPFGDYVNSGFEGSYVQFLEDNYKKN